MMQSFFFDAPVSFLTLVLYKMFTNLHSDSSGRLAALVQTVTAAAA